MINHIALAIPIFYLFLHVVVRIYFWEFPYLSVRYFTLDITYKLIMIFQLIQQWDMG
ncbi:conserved hypothetical protein [Xenorhabdus nematophila F1]|uniref:Uncharacterized protein n=1 Tax=Xenorhabdus nematophila (strain ATCC 19061 / DSM 3370 / CCUG 14189 / LMG 1036 / NCIMB 9965 / AN6) TaxID=406817 RepID=D3VEJ2_XENNA|nr:hypothetical protein XNC1_2044 [Xenorhabdus nematophila ATCC 19061]CCW32037.1 conserved hypothetical protein [Xenorhabdus nematophila F1]CEE92471.1 hypothetical protein XNA1_2910005 [Xenorhabdus nematophila str. Anatoliense]CEF30046.1 hypothetical protein XNW1_2200005 [Xenorhabdus nematophila str. Websteri]CEK22971.1 hypothetical protein XNC2_1977 [Xenorhabdus nematophila AN6/1]